MKKQTPINTTADNTAYTVTARYGGAALCDLTGGGGVFPQDRSTGNNRVRVVGSINSSQDGVVVSPYGLSPCLTSGHGNCTKIAHLEEYEELEEIPPARTIPAARCPT